MIGRVFWDGSGLRARRRRPARFRPARRARLRAAPRELVAGRGARVRNQARAHARGRVRQPPEVGTRTSARRLRGLARAAGRRARGTRAAAGLPLRGGRSVPTISTLPGEAASRRRRRCASRQSPGCGGPPTSPSGATRSTRAWPCCAGPSSSSSLIPCDRPSCGTSIGHASALNFDGPLFREAMERAIELGGPPAELHAELALQVVRRSGMWVRPPEDELVETWVQRALELSPEGSPTYPQALAALALLTSDESAALELQAVAERLGDPELRSQALAALTAVAWRAEDIPRRARGGRAATRGAGRDSSAPDDLHFALMQAIHVRVAQGDLASAAQRQLAAQRDGRGPDSASPPAWRLLAARDRDARMPLGRPCGR